MDPKVTVILPFSNCERCINTAVRSILLQTYTNFELILVNNNSKDGTLDILSEFASEDARIKIVDAEKQSFVNALNTGLSYAKGKYIARMDADDISYPDRLKKQVEYLEKNTRVGLVACQVNHVSTMRTLKQLEGIKHYVDRNNQLITNEDIVVNRFVEAPVIHPTIMFRKSIINKFGGYLHGDFPEDYELFLRWIDNGIKMHKLPEVLYDWTDLPERVTGTDNHFTDQAFFEVKSRYIFKWLQENNQHHPNVVIWGAGKKSRQRFLILHELGIYAKFYIDLWANPTYNVIQFQETPPAGRHFILSYVTNREAREQIKAFLVELGYLEGRDFLCVA